MGVGGSLLSWTEQAKPDQTTSFKVRKSTVSTRTRFCSLCCRLLIPDFSHSPDLKMGLPTGAPSTVTGNAPGCVGNLRGSFADRR